MTAYFCHTHIIQNRTFAWIIFNPEYLLRFAGVDVNNGRIKRYINQEEVWEECPELINEYYRLYCYVKGINSFKLVEKNEKYGNKNIK